MHRFLRFSAFCLAAWPAGAIAEEWWWQWEDSPSGVFRDFRPLLLGGTLLPLEPGSSVPAMAGPAISSPGGGAPARALKPARSSSQESPAVRPPAGPVGRSNPGPVSNLGGGTPVAGGMEMAARSPSAYQGMGVADGFYAAGSGRVGFSSGNGMVWQLLVPWYGYLIISPGFLDPAWDYPLTGIFRPVQPLPLTPSQPGYEISEGESFPVLQSPGYVIWLSAHQL